jgi:hypothetical protein
VGCTRCYCQCSAQAAANVGGWRLLQCPAVACIVLGISQNSTCALCPCHSCASETTEPTPPLSTTLYGKQATSCWDPSDSDMAKPRETRINLSMSCRMQRPQWHHPTMSIIPITHDGTKPISLAQLPRPQSLSGMSLLSNPFAGRHLGPRLGMADPPINHTHFLYLPCKIFVHKRDGNTTSAQSPYTPICPIQLH